MGGLEGMDRVWKECVQWLVCMPLGLAKVSPRRGPAFSTAASQLCQHVMRYADYMFPPPLHMLPCLLALPSPLPPPHPPMLGTPGPEVAAGGRRPGGARPGLSQERPMRLIRLDSADSLSCECCRLCRQQQAGVWRRWRQRGGGQPVRPALGSVPSTPSASPESQPAPPGGAGPAWMLQLGPKRAPLVAGLAAGGPIGPAYRLITTMLQHRR